MKAVFHGTDTDVAGFTAFALLLRGSDLVRSSAPSQTPSRYHDSLVLHTSAILHDIPFREISDRRLALKEMA